MKTRFGLVCFDVDSTLVDVEGIDFLAGGNPEIVTLTEAAMNGEIPLEEVYGRRLEIVRPTRARLEELAREYVARRISDAAAVIAELRAAHVDVHLVTAGIEQAILPLAASLGLEPRVVHAVRVELDDDGNYLDYDRRSPLTRSGGKETVVINIRSRTKGKVAFVGDGVSDLETKAVVDLFVGFGGVKRRAEVEKESPVYITEKSLRPLLPYLEVKS
jgi:phosphoserine phosphatase